MSKKQYHIGLLAVFLFIPLIDSTRLNAQEKRLDDNPGYRIVDGWHYSHVFGENRKFRIFFPATHDTNPNKRYPVIYFLHGWAQRYFGSVADQYSNYDAGDDNDGENIANFVAKHDVIVVKLDGYNRYPDEPYDLTPYNIGTVDSHRQFPLYFEEFVAYFDAHYRTIPDRNHRAISGLSMGGFMTFWISGKYPHLLSAAGNFCGSPEFTVGPKALAVEYKNMDMYNNYAGLKVRFHYGTRDNLRFYHRDMNKIWTQVMDNFEYKVYDAAHTTCGLNDMFEFILKTFENPPEKPAQWHHIDVYPDFSIWGYRISSDRFVPGFTILENVDKNGFKSSVKTFLPDGELMPFVKLSITTPPVYEKNQSYVISDTDLFRRKSTMDTIVSTVEGELVIALNGSSHNIGINKINALPNISVASVRIQNMNWAVNNKEVKLDIELLNKGGSTANGVQVRLLPFKNGSVNIVKGNSKVRQILVNETKKCQHTLSFLVSSDSIEIAKFKLITTDEAGNTWSEFFEVAISNDVAEVNDFVIADGREYTIAQAGIDSATVLLGKGNGDGKANPGESIVVLVNHKNRYYATNLYTSSPYVNPTAHIRKSDNWAGYDHVNGSAKYSIPVVSSECPPGQEVEFLAEYWTPENKDHVIRKCKIKTIVTGRDETPAAVEWVYVTADNTLQVRMYDGGRINRVTALLQPVKDVVKLDYMDVNLSKEVIEVELYDTGDDGDKVAGDNVFSKKIPAQSANFYNIKVISEDAYGNTGEEQFTEIYEVF